MTTQAPQRSSLGADYSGSAAYLGCVSQGVTLAYKEFRMLDSPYTFRHAIQDWLAEISVTHNTWPEFWIEQPFVAGGRFPQVALQLVRTAAFLEAAAQDAGIEPCFVHPLTWRKRVYGNGRPDDTKQRARDGAKELLGFESRYKNQHNQAEGLLIAYYGYLQHHPEAFLEESTALKLIRRAKVT